MPLSQRFTLTQYLIEQRRRFPDASGDFNALILDVALACKAIARAVAAGARVLMPAADQFYGDRCGNVTDPFGHRWHLATHVEDVPEDEMRRRMAAWSDGYWWSNDGLRLHYRDYPGPADKPPILCIPGLTRNARDFAGLAVSVIELGFRRR